MDSLPFPYYNDDAFLCLLESCESEGDSDDFFSTTDACAYPMMPAAVLSPRCLQLRTTPAPLFMNLLAKQSPLHNHELHSLWPPVARPSQPCAPPPESYEPRAFDSPAVDFSLCAPSADVDAAYVSAAEEDFGSPFKRRKLGALCYPTGSDKVKGFIRSPRHVADWEDAEGKMSSSASASTSDEEDKDKTSAEASVDEGEDDEEEFCHELLNAALGSGSARQRPSKRPAQTTQAPVAATVTPPPAPLPLPKSEAPRMGRGGARKARMQSLLGQMTPVRPASPAAAALGGSAGTDGDADDSSECGEENATTYGLDESLWIIVERGVPCQQPNCEYRCRQRQISMRRHFHARCSHVHRKGKREGLPFYTHQREKAYKHQRVHLQEKRKGRAERRK